MNSSQLESRSSVDNKFIEAVAHTSDIIRILFESLNVIFSEITLTFTKDGVYLFSTNEQKILTVHLILDHFERYFCKELFNASMNCLYFYKMIKTCTQDDVITFIIETPQATELIVKCENHKNKYISYFKINLLDIDYVQPQNTMVPKIEFDVEVTIPSKQFQKICKNMFHLSDTLQIETTKQQITFSCVGDYASQKTVFTQDTDSKMNMCHSKDNIGGHKIISGQYDLSYLMLFNKCANMSPLMTLFLKNDLPLIVRYGVSTLGYIYFYVMPKIVKDTID